MTMNLPVPDLEFPTLHNSENGISVVYDIFLIAAYMDYDGKNLAILQLTSDMLCEARALWGD